MSLGSAQTIVAGFDAFNFDGTRRKRVKLDPTLDDIGEASVVTQAERLKAKTFFNVGDAGTLVRHQEHEDPDSIVETHRHTLDLHGLSIAGLEGDFFSAERTKLVFYDTARPANGTQPEAFSISVDNTGLAQTITLPGPIRFEEGISVRFVRSDGLPAIQELDVVTLFYREVSATSLISTAPDTVVEGESIQAAIDAATAGDTIRVGRGTYPESVTINKPGLTLVARGNVEIGGPIVIEEDDVTLDGFTQRAAPGFDFIALFCAAGDNVVVQNMTFEGFQIASSGGTHNNLTYSRNTFLNNDVGIGGTGTSTGLRIENNRFEQNVGGIHLDIGATLAEGSTVAEVLGNNLFIGNVNAMVDFRDDPPTEYDNDGSVKSGEEGGAQVVEVLMTNFGTGYNEASPPFVFFSQPEDPFGFSAEGSAIVVGGAVTEILLSTGGTGYTNAPTITIDPPLMFDDEQATAIAIISTVGGTPPGEFELL